MCKNAGAAGVVGVAEYSDAWRVCGVVYIWCSAGVVVDTLRQPFRVLLPGCEMPRGIG
jgi:hypothetical protein